MFFHTPYGIVRHKTIILNSFHCVQPHCQTPKSGVFRQPRCSYTLSRFPRKRPVGPGRSRKILKPKISPSKKDPSQDGYQDTDIPSAKELPVWYTSQHPSVSNAEEGLQRLLMQNETLIIERCWNALQTLIKISSFLRQLEMLNIFVGFEQCNKYTISASLIVVVWARVNLSKFRR